MSFPPNRSVNDMIEEHRKELERLMAGALRHLGVDRHDLSVMRRSKVDVFDPEEAIFLVKADTEPMLSPEDVSFIASNLANINYLVKRIEQRGERLLLFV
jgi:hypothetical protein